MKKNLLLLLAIALIAVLLIRGVEIESVEEYYLSHSEDVGEGDPYVLLSIRCDGALASGRIPASVRTLLPEDGIILPPTKLRLREGDSVYDLLSRAVRTHRIAMEISRSAGEIYVEGLAHLYERDAGDLSGWIFWVGDTRPERACSSVCPSDGDTVVWEYSCDLGLG